MLVCINRGRAVKKEWEHKCSRELHCQCCRVPLSVSAQWKSSFNCSWYPPIRYGLKLKKKSLRSKRLSCIAILMVTYFPSTRPPIWSPLIHFIYIPESHRSVTVRPPASDYAFKYYLIAQRWIELTRLACYCPSGNYTFFGTGSRTGARNHHTGYVNYCRIGYAF